MCISCTIIVDCETIIPCVNRFVLVAKSNITVATFCINYVRSVYCKWLWSDGALMPMTPSLG